ncbi:MAG: hypothetical protein ACRCTP_03895 [Aeromonas popoffii]|uniref:hypothetical protein n=1 Tax=Aeromonas popoffii TaxID=70856 RepID=UPI003F3626D3
MNAITKLYHTDSAAVVELNPSADKAEQFTQLCFSETCSGLAITREELNSFLEGWALINGEWTTDPAVSAFTPDLVAFASVTVTQPSTGASTVTTLYCAEHMKESASKNFRNYRNGDRPGAVEADLIIVAKGL